MMMIASGAMLLAWLLAAGITYPLRKRMGRVSGTDFVALSLDLLAHVARPLMVIGVTQVFLVLLRSWPAGHQWMIERPAHLSAWQLFWLGVALIGLIEGVVLVVFRRRGKAFPVPDLLLDILRAILVVAVALAVLRWEVGLDIGPLLASTALVTAVVGFALQGVLGNLLAGMSMHLVSTLRPGVWVEVDGVMGKVVKTNWRETRIRTPGGHMYIIPNGRIADSKIHNFQEPTPLRRHEIHVGASYSDAPDNVIEALLEAARDVPEVRSAPVPEALITEFQDYGINYRLTFWTTELQKNIPISGHVNRNIWYRFQRRGIEIPFPMSDKLLNDFMAVVYNQRKFMPEAEDVAMVLQDLLASDLDKKVLVDDQGTPLVAQDDWSLIAPLVKRQPYTEGEFICRQGQAGESFWILAKGSIAGQVTKNGELAAEFDLMPGSVVGEMSVLTGAPRSATLKAKEGCEMLEFGPSAFRALLLLHDDLPESLSRLAAQRADENRAALEALDAASGKDSGMVLEQQNILKRFMRLMGR